ncbi:nuclear factor 7, brain-like [Nelusetta ayraudi]|uniref:nuclear factor 7, brain-like n=1 Tax=Nelusetta ayraudi TaxID=303726 RepID=UPI003F713C63
MAEKLARVESLLNCSVCLETFKDPVTLSCTHSFCSKCLQTFWETNESKNCPVCRRKSSMEFPLVNFVLKELVESLADSQQSGSSETVEAVKVELLCKHKAETIMFCEVEQKALCSVCEFSLHQGHKVVPVEEAVPGLKEQLKSNFTALKDKKKKYGEVELKFKQVIQHLEKQASSTEKQIRAEFDKLRLFLREEEESRLAALREEEEQKRKTVIREMEKIQEKMSSLSITITAVEKELQQKDTMVFLNSYKGLQSRARDQCSQSEPQLLPGALINVAKHLGNLSFTVWQKMKDQVHFSPVILDPNTAHCWLHLSDDLTSVRYGETPQQLPDNPERHTRYANVVGSEGFSSGQHSWEVEVGDHPWWTIGVAKESADRKGEIYASPKYGLWCLPYENGEYTDVSGDTDMVKKSVERLRVQLDFDQGKVSFYDAVDQTHIYTLEDTFTEKLFPFFSVGEAGDQKTADIRMCERDFSVMFEKEFFSVSESDSDPDSDSD